MDLYVGGIEHGRHSTFIKYSGFPHAYTHMQLFSVHTHTAVLCTHTCSCSPYTHIQLFSICCMLGSSHTFFMTLDLLVLKNLSRDYSLRYPHHKHTHMHSDTHSSHTCACTHTHTHHTRAHTHTLREWSRERRTRIKFLADI